jgi:ribonuclease PH
MRGDGRTLGELRPVSIERGFIKNPEGSVLIKCGDTHVICTATVDENVPPFLRGGGKGWVTAEYSMLPGSASGGRINRNASQKGRAQEISRLIGRSLRAVVDMEALGERQILVDCDVIQADGGTRTASITGAFVALSDAIASVVEKNELSKNPLVGQCAAVSVGFLKGEGYLDLCYTEDSTADVDLNLVMTSAGSIIEVQGTAEGESFNRGELNTMLDLGEKGIRELFALQTKVLSDG